MTTTDVRWRIAAARRLLYRHGCDSGIAGHVSQRAEDGSSFWVTPFEFFDETVPESVVRLSLDLELLEGEGTASPAVQFHASIYAARPDVGSVIHTHSRNAIIFSTLGIELGMFHAAATIFAGRQALFRDDGVLPLAHGPAIVSALGDAGLLIMQNHGALVASHTLEDATVEAITFEQQADIHLASATAGGKPMHHDEVLQNQADYDKHYRKMTWDAIVRRLRQTDPDLFTHLPA
jgi:L-fuculose-phosphate aldolase